MLADFLIRSKIADFLSSWSSIKASFENWTGASHDLLHVAVGLAAWLIIAAVSRRPLSSFVPLILTFALAGINEASDLWTEIWPERARQNLEMAKDLLLTMALPTLLFTAARLRPSLFRVRNR